MLGTRGGQVFPQVLGVSAFAFAARSTVSRKKRKRGARRHESSAAGGLSIVRTDPVPKWVGNYEPANSGAAVVWLNVKRKQRKSAFSLRNSNNSKTRNQNEPLMSEFLEAPSVTVIESTRARIACRLLQVCKTHSDLAHIGNATSRLHDECGTVTDTCRSAGGPAATRRNSKAQHAENR